MKKIWTLLFALTTVLLAGCQGDQNRLEPIFSDSISQDVYNDLQREWDSWNLLSRESKMFSSHLPGYCQRSFDDWAECETFLGFFIPNPVEECTWLEQATYVAMPAGFMDAPRIQASWYGTEDAHVEWISVQSGYRNGDIRVTIDATLYGDTITNQLGNYKRIFFQYGLPSVRKYLVLFSSHRRSRCTITGRRYIGSGHRCFFGRI